MSLPDDPDAWLRAFEAAALGAPDGDGALAEALADLAWAIAPGAPAASVRARLLAAACGGRLEPWLAPFAAMFDLAATRAREILAWLEEPRRWQPALPGITLTHFPGGPAVAGSDCGLVRVAPGVAFPWHGHRDDEHSLFLAGRGRDHAGVVYQPGDTLVMAAGAGHAFTSIGDDELVLAVRHRGVDFTARPPT